MTRIPLWLTIVFVATFAVLGEKAISAQDKYSVQVPDGLALSEFKGYETWQVIGVSQSGDLIEVNPYPSELTAVSRYTLQGPAGEVLPRLASLVRARL